MQPATRHTTNTLTLLSVHRFSFNGGEAINEVYGKDNYVDLGERGVDTRLGRLNWSIDPLSKEYPWQSPYAYYANSPIWQIDFKGMGDDKERASNPNDPNKKGGTQKFHQKKVEIDKKNTPNTPKPPVTPTPAPTNTPTPPSVPEGATLKRTREVFVNPGVKVDAYSTITPTPSASPLEAVIDVQTGELESTNIKTSIGTFSYGTDGSHAFGNSIFSTGTSASGNLILDISIPTGKNTSLGTTLLFNTNALKAKMDYIMEGVHQGLSKPNPFFIPLPTPVPILLPIVP